MALGRYAIPNVRDSQNHRLRVALDAGKVSVWIDGINYVPNFALPGYVPFTGHWGFTGGTVAASEAHWITDVTMSFPNGTRLRPLIGSCRVDPKDPDSFSRASRSAKSPDLTPAPRSIA